MAYDHPLSLEHEPSCRAPVDGPSLRSPTNSLAPSGSRRPRQCGTSAARAAAVAVDAPVAAAAIRAIAGRLVSTKTERRMRTASAHDKHVFLCEP